MKTRSAVAVLALGLLSLTGCGAGSTAPGPANAPAKPEPAKQEPAKRGFDVEGALKRESNRMAVQAVDAGSWRAQIPAAAPPVPKRDKEVWFVPVDIGSEAAVQCFVYEQIVDTGDVIARFLNLLDSEKLRVHAVRTTGITIMREAPTVFVEAQYSAPAPGGRSVGMLKIAAHAHETHPIACVHDELGYRQSFASVVESLAKSVTGLPEPPANTFAEISTLTLGELIVGFQYGRLKVDSSGTSNWFERSVHLLPRSATQLAISDSATFERSDAAGRFTEGMWSEAEGGELRLEMKLARRPSGKYAYEGTAHGKPVSGEFAAKTKTGVESTVSSTRSLARAAKTGAFTLVQEGYVPSVDPTKPLEVRYESKAPPAVRGTMLDRTIEGKLAPDGRLDAWELTINGAKLASRRVFSKGSF